MSQDAPPATPKRANFEFSTEVGGDMILDCHLVRDPSSVDDLRLYLAFHVCSNPQDAQAEHDALAAGVQRSVPPVLLDDAEIDIEADATQQRATVVLSRAHLDVLIDQLVYARARWTA